MAHGAFSSAFRSLLVGQGSTDPRDYVCEPTKLAHRPHGRFLGIDTEFVTAPDGSTHVGRLAVVEFLATDGRLVTLLDTFVQVPADVVEFKTSISGLTRANTGGGMSRAALTEWWRRCVQEDDFVCAHDAPGDLAALGLTAADVPRLMDTVQLWPHHDGPPYKHSLQFLAAQFLKMTIQEAG